MKPWIHPTASSGGGNVANNYLQSTHAELDADINASTLAPVLSVTMNVLGEARRHIITGIISAYSTDPAGIPTIALAIDGAILPLSQHAGAEGTFIEVTSVIETDMPLAPGDHTFEVWAGVTSGQLLFLVVEEPQWENVSIVVEELTA